ncbi:MAG: esterase/lipase family protein [Nannocystaceae bacterium]|nr:alpha/beta fold hydrolase [bacterium]
MRNATLLLIALIACDADSSAESSICVEANEAVEMCLGVPPQAPSNTCNADEAAIAQELIDGIEAAGCEGVPVGKDDSFLCGSLLWDPLGWCEAAPDPLGPEPQGEPTRHPIILAHGFNTSTTNFWRFNDVDVALIEDGHDVVLGSVPPFDTPQVRAGFLARQVDELLAHSGADKVNLVCFSMGGIDCRYLVSPDGLGYGDRVASVSTISAPHRGTFVADVAVGFLPDEDEADAIDAIATLYGSTFSDVAEDSHIVAALAAMSERGMAEFNAEIRDAPGVMYQSWAGVSNVAGLPNPRINAETDACTDEHGQLLFMRHEGKRDRMDALLVGAAGFVAHGLELRPNDGVATVESAKWGRFRGCYPGDHLDAAGQINDHGADPRTGFDYIRFYRNLAFDLAAQGF